MYCILASYMYHITRYVPVWPETSYNIHFSIPTHSIEIAKDIVQKLANGVIKDKSV